MQNIGTMDEKGYISLIEDCQDEIDNWTDKKVKTILRFRDEHGFDKGDKVKLTRTQFDLASGKDLEEQYYLFVKSCSYKEKMQKFVYTFQHVSPTGKPSEAKCNVHHQPFTDKLEKCL